MSATRAILSAVRTAGPDEAPDAELLQRFADGRDEAAFEVLVRRHAALVWGVCRRVLGQAQDAEDAFQATFLVLARNPTKPRKSGSAAGFLFGVARRVARKARGRAAAWAARVPPPVPGPKADPTTEAALRELQAILDDEIGRLPAAYQLPFLLCVVEGRPRGEVATELGVNPGTLSGRLARARLLLRDRLARRGVTFAAAVAATDLAGSAAVVPVGLIRSAVAVGVAGRGGRTVAGLIGEFRVWPVALGLAGGLLACAAAATGLAIDDTSRSAAPPPPVVGVPAGEPPPAADARGDPLPAGAVARLGSARWRHEGEAQSISCSPDGKTVAVLSTSSGTVTLFETTTGRVLHQFPRPAQGAGGPGTIAFSPDSAVLACRLHGGVVQFWNPRTKDVVRTLTPFSGEARIEDSGRAPICFSPDGKLFAASAGEAVVTVWEVATGRQVATLKGHNHINPALAFSPNGKILFLAASKPTVQLWDVQTGKFLRGFDPDQGSVLSLAVSADGRMIASGSDSTRDRIVVSDVASGQEIARFEAKGMNGVLDLAFTPDGKSLLSGSEDAKVRVWDTANARAPVVLDGRGWIGRSMALSADGKTVAMGTVYNVVRVWDLPTGREHSAPADGHDAPVHTVAFSPDGRLLATGGEHQQIHLWDPTTGRLVRQFNGQSASQVSFSPDGRRLASAWKWNKTARVWDIDRADAPREFAHDKASEVPGIAFGADNQTVVTASWRWNRERPLKDTPRTTGVLSTWALTTGKVLRAAELPGGGQTVLALSPDGGLAAVGGWGEAPLWLCDLKRGQERRLPQNPWDTVKSVAFSSDGRVLASGGFDRESVANGTIRHAPRLWESLTGREITTLTGHERTVTAVVFVPGGRVLATADGDGAPHSVRFWDTVTGRELARLDGHGSNVMSLAFSPDGRRFVTGLQNGTVLIWETPAAAKPPAAPKRDLRPNDLAALKADLAGDDAGKAYAAVWALVAAPEQAVPFLAETLRPAEKVDTAKIRQRVADLGREEFAVREAAEKELAGWGEDVEAELRAAQAGKPSPEQAVRLDRLLALLPRLPSPDRRREVRGVWALELIGTPPARRVLTALAAGAPDARLTHEAKTALGRR